MFCLVVGLSFFNSFLTLFAGRLTLLSCHLVVLAMLLFDLRFLGLFWTCYMIFFCSIPVAQYYHWACTYAVLSFLGPFHSFRFPWPISFFWASSTCFISLGIPAHSNPSFSWIFANFFGFP